MDRLASEGVRFERAYSANPVCVPARFSIMTGLMPSAINMLSNQTKDVGEIPSAILENGIGHLLRRAGYRTAYGGKEHLPNMKAEDLGFEYICKDEREQLAKECLAFLRELDGASPFFLVASFINPHDICYMAIRDFAESDKEKRMVERGREACETLDRALERPEGVDEAAFFAAHCPPLPDNFEAPTDEPEAITRMLEERPFRIKARREWSENRWREHRWAYAKLTEFVDHQIGELIDGLDDMGLMKNTMVIFTSDHGDMDASRRMEHKSTLYDEACRVPLIIRPAGGMKPGRVDNEHVVSNGLDVVPTICDWASCEIPANTKGLSLRPLVDGQKTAWRQSVPIECAIGRAIVTRDYKYARYDFGKNAEQFFHVETDPLEVKNLVMDESHADALQKMRSHFEKVFEGKQRDPSEIMKALNQA